MNIRIRLAKKTDYESVVRLMKKVIIIGCPGSGKTTFARNRRVSR